jgi:hypothetical protein
VTECKILKDSVRESLSVLYQVLHTKPSGFIQNGTLFYVMFCNSFISSHITGTIKSTKFFWDIGKGRIAGCFRPLDTDTYMYEGREYNIKMDLIGMGY